MENFVKKINESKIITDFRRDVKNPFFIIFFFIGGNFFFVFGVYFIVMNINFMNRTVATEGIVVQHRILPSTDDYGTHDYISVVEFRTSEGELITFEDGSVDVSIGKKVKVRYDPSNPSDARIYSVSNYWVLPSIFAVGSAVLFIIGLWGWFSKRKSEREIKRKWQFKT